MTEPLHGCVDDAKKIRQFLIGQWTASEAALVAISDDFLSLQMITGTARTTSSY